MAIKAGVYLEAQPCNRDRPDLPGLVEGQRSAGPGRLGGGLSSAWRCADGVGEGLTGALGTGSGKWQLAVSASRPVVVMSLPASATGYLSNLSTVPAAAESED